MNKLSGIFLLSYGFIWSFSINSETMKKPLAEFSGEGIIKVPPDFISLTLAIKSECQPTPLEAQNYTDDVVSKIDNYFKKLQRKGDANFKILIDGGYTTTFSRWYQNHVYCRNTFQKNTNIVLKMGARKDFDKIFSNIQTFVLQQFEQNDFIEASDMARTFVTVGTPTPELTRNHRRAIEKKAYDLALKDAKENFKAAISSCESQHPKIHSIRENRDPGIVTPAFPRAHFQALGADSMAEKSFAPVKFDDLEVAKTLSVDFEFDGTLCFEREKSPAS